MKKRWISWKAKQKMTSFAKSASLRLSGSVNKSVTSTESITLLGNVCSAVQRPFSSVEVAHITIVNTATTFNANSKTVKESIVLLESLILLLAVM